MRKSEDNLSLSEIVSQYSDGLFAYIRRQVDTREDAEDVLQEVFYQLSKSAEGSGSEIEKVSAWLYRVAHNTILNMWRKKREVSADGMMAGEGGLEVLSDMLFNSPYGEPENDYLRKLVWQELEYALAELPPEQSETFCMTTFDGVPAKVIAENLGIPVATVLSRKHYAVKHLRIRLRGLYEDLMY